MPGVVGRQPASPIDKDADSAVCQNDDVRIPRMNILWLPIRPDQAIQRRGRPKAAEIQGAVKHLESSVGQPEHPWVLGSARAVYLPICSAWDLPSIKRVDP